MMRLLPVMFLLGCATDRVTPHPGVVAAAMAPCDPAFRLVKDVCTKLGPDDACVATGDVCIALCDQASACAVVDPALRVLDPWPVAPGGYCVVCLQP
jgi:hypothetical protein